MPQWLVDFRTAIVDFRTAINETCSSPGKGSSLSGLRSVGEICFQLWAAGDATNREQLNEAQQLIRFAPQFTTPMPPPPILLRMR
ncbi:MAG: hypothetical protein DMG79_04345 [Acidobacteria bacterium]|nr:MAG: hypothetical protein DMG79_04345 [Acidobacteriota bacterium]